MYLIYLFEAKLALQMPNGSLQQNITYLISSVFRFQKDVALISLANVLHRAQNSNEAAIVVHAALDVSKELNVNHFTLGNIYAVSSSIRFTARWRGCSVPIFTKVLSLNFSLRLKSVKHRAEFKIHY